MSEKILTVAIPCYNSQDYVTRALDSLIPAGPAIEVIVVDDGSTDRTAEIAKEYVEKYPDIVRYVYKENGGHGDAVMSGIREATGLYYRVVDSDDWYNTDNLIRMITRLSEDRAKGKVYDMVVTNYVYEKVGEKNKKEVGYSSALPVEQEFTWDDMKDFNVGQYMLMHSIAYRLELLRTCGLRLPKHTFYVDNLYAYYPLPFVKSIFYFNFDLYHYFIGREDQSVNEKQLFKRIDQQVLVAYTMFGMHDLDRVENKKLRKYMAQYNAVLAAICSALYVRMGGKENRKKKREFWNRVKSRYHGVYKYMKKFFLIGVVRRTNWFFDSLTMIGYFICRKIYHFN